MILFSVTGAPSHDVEDDEDSLPSLSDDEDSLSSLSDDEDSLSSLSDVEEELAARQCEECGKVCTNAHYLRQHIMYGRCSKSKASVGTHNSLSQSSPPSFVCPSCRKAFHTQFILDTHLLSHTHPNESYSDGTVTLRLNKYSLERD